MTTNILTELEPQPHGGALQRSTLIDPEPPRPTAQDRQDARLGNVPELYRTTHERLAVELALHVEDAEEIFARYHYTVEQAAELLASAAFTALLERVSREVRETGLSFRMKARAIAEDLLPYAHEMATDPLASSAVRADLIKWSAKVADLEPKDSKDAARVGGGLTLSITFAGQAPQQVVSGREPLTIEQEG